MCYSVLDVRMHKTDESTIDPIMRFINGFHPIRFRKTAPIVRAPFDSTFVTLIRIGCTPVIHPAHWFCAVFRRKLIYLSGPVRDPNRIFTKLR